MSPAQREAHNKVQKQSYRRRVARAAAQENRAEIEGAGITVLERDDIPRGCPTEDVDLSEIGPNETVTVPLEEPTWDAPPWVDEPRDEDEPQDAPWGSPEDEDAPRQDGDGTEDLKVMEARDGAMVVQIDSEEDYQRMRERYPLEGDEYELDYDAMRKDGISGVYVTEKAAKELDLEQSSEGPVPDDDEDASGAQGVGAEDEGEDKPKGWKGWSGPKKAAMVVLIGAMFTVALVSFVAYRASKD